MLETIGTAISVYISTSIDYLFILLIFFSQLTNKSHKAHIYAGQYIGTGILVAVSLIAAYVVHFIPADWLVGLLGLIPLFLGIRFAIVGEGDADEAAIIEELNSRHSSRLFWTVTLLTIASGGDNLGIYIPYFSAIDGWQIIVVLIVFIIGIIVLVEMSHSLSTIPTVAETIEKYEQIIVPIVFIGIGLYILLENNTIQTIYRFLT